MLKYEYYTNAYERNYYICIVVSKNNGRGRSKNNTSQTLNSCKVSILSVICQIFDDIFKYKLVKTSK